MNVESFLAELPPQVRYERHELPAEENALGPWLAAGEAIVEPERTKELCDDVLYRPGVCAWEECELAPLPTGNVRAEIDDLLARNAPALESFDEGLARGRLQLPPQRKPSSSLADDPVVGPWRTLSRMRQTRAIFMHADGNLEQAAHDAIARHRMGALLCAGEGVFVPYITGTSLRTSGLEFMSDLCRETGADSTIGQKVLRELEEALEREDGYATTLRVEATCYAVPAVASLPDGQGINALVDALLKSFYGDTPIDNVLDDDPDRVPDDILQARLALRRRQLLHLLDGHPRPFEPLATTRLVGEQFSDALDRAAAGPPPAEGRVRRAVSSLRYRIGWDRWRGVKRGWPESLLPSTSIEWFGIDEVAQRKRDQIREWSDVPKWFVRSLAPVSDAQIDRYAARLRRISNPVGEVVAMQLESDYQQLGWDYRAKLEATWRELNSKTAACPVVSFPISSHSAKTPPAGR